MDHKPPVDDSLDRQDERPESLADRAVKFSIIGSFLILLFGVLYFAQSLLLPVMLAFLFALILSPIVRTLLRYGIPEGVTAVMLVVMMATTVTGGVYFLSEPAAEWFRNAPSIGMELKRKLEYLREPVETLKEAEKQVEEATGGEAEFGVQEVVVKEPGLLSRAARGAPDVIAGGILTLVLLLFLLASGDMFYEKLVRVLPTLTDKKQGLRIARDVEREVSRYLLTITTINIALGIVIAAAFHAIGMPNPILWGVVATALNFIPYVGAIIGITIAAIVSIVSFPTLGQALAAPVIYMAVTLMEGQFATPALVGRRLQINGVSVFLAVAFWGWLWGFAGIFIAVPVLIVIKVFALHVDGLGGLHEFLSPRNSEAAEDAEQD
jgi:predicted PurR-regulated permease PerM